MIKMEPLNKEECIFVTLTQNIYDGGSGYTTAEKVQIYIDIDEAITLLKILPNLINEKRQIITNRKKNRIYELEKELKKLKESI